MGSIVIFEIGVKGNKILGNSLILLIGNAEQKKFGCVSSISISRDNKYLVAGYDSGLVTLWDLYYFTLVKQEINSRAKILQVLFCSSTS
jgi:WD40 repeat protein